MTYAKLDYKATEGITRRDTPLIIDLKSVKNTEQLCRFVLTMTSTIQNLLPASIQCGFQII